MICAPFASGREKGFFFENKSKNRFLRVRLDFYRADFQFSDL
jgi:hypothetical protein